MISINSLSVTLFALFLVGCFTVSESSRLRFWDDIRTTWGPNISALNYFVHLPRTETEARNSRWKMISTTCDASLPWKAKRYAQVPDLSVVALYCVQGKLMGIQIGIPEKTSYYDFPSYSMQKWFLLDYVNRYYYSTVWFSPPEMACAGGRNQSDIEMYGYGRQLSLQEGDSQLYLNNNCSFHRQHPWKQGKCMPTMGRHYWNDVGLHTDCSNYFPIFILCDGDGVSGFGWILTAYYNSTRFEHPPLAAINRFMDVTPMCLQDGQITSMHVFLTSDIPSIGC